MIDYTVIINRPGQKIVEKTNTLNAAKALAYDYMDTTNVVFRPNGKDGISANNGVTKVSIYKLVS